METGINFFFRVDAYAEIGTGHLMRCFALANVAKARGVRTIFVGAIMDDILQTRIREAGHDLILLPHVSYDDEWLLNLNFSGADWIILDGYAFDQKNHNAIKNAGARLLLIDDMGEFDFYQCDILLNQNFSANKFLYIHPSETKVLLGPSYALLRDEFSRHKPVRVNNGKQRVLITLGGSDPDGVGLLVLAALKKIKGGLNILYIAGSSNAHLEKINIAAKEIEQMGNQIKVCAYTQDMPGAMAWADIGLIAAGSTSLEVAYMGLPCLLLVLAKNQIDVAEAMHSLKIAESLGEYQKVSPELIADSLGTLLRDISKRNLMSEKSQKIIDGAGAQRVVEEMLEY